MDRDERQRILQEIAKNSFSRTGNRIPGRAWEPYMKKQVLERLEALWDQHPDLRFGALISNIFDDPSSIYYTEDFELVEKLEAFYEHRKTL